MTALCDLAWALSATGDATPMLLDAVALALEPHLSSLGRQPGASLEPLTTACGSAFENLGTAGPGEPHLGWSGRSALMAGDMLALLSAYGSKSNSGPGAAR